MVTIVDYSVCATAEGKEFCVLVLQGGIEMVKSKTTGRYYATSKRCQIPSTFDEQTCKSVIGEKLTGSIKKISCDPYDYAVPESGEIIELNYRWEYLAERESIEECVFEGIVEPALI
jgi:hypothetical protein